MKLRFKISALYLLPLTAVILVAAAGCASMGRPQGGPRDIDPPVFVSSNPKPGQLNVDQRRLRIYFDENVQIKDPGSKVVISPVQRMQPAVSAVGKYVQVEFRDTMLANTTYTVDFSDGISDLNEGNVLDGFAVDFSTGDSLDSLRISGMVFEAATLEPAQGMIVGVYSNLSDTAISTLPFERITKTNQTGHFTIRNLKPGSYRIFALNDLNRDYHWDRSEDIAFYDTLITPTAERVEVNDTLKGADGSDSIVSRSVTAFYPNDILLTWFNENYKSQYLMNNNRPERRKIQLEMGAPSDTFPTLRVVGSDFDGLTDSDWSVRVSSATRDTLTYWITDTALANIDSLQISVTYQRTDSLDQLAWTTDTLRMFLRGNKSRKAELKRQADELEKRRKALEKGDTLPEPALPALDIKLASGATVDVDRNLVLNFSQPVVKFDTAAVRLDIKVDTLWEPVAPPHLTFPNPYDHTVMRGEVEWVPGSQYRLSIDSAAVTGALGEVNRPFHSDFSVKRLEDYSMIKFNLSGADSTAVVQLLSSDKPVASVAVDPVTMSATFEYVNPGAYYARLFLDRNGDGIYSGGSLTDSIQPEEVYYYPKKINLKKNWNVEQSWNIYELPLDLQKPNDIKTNKPPKPAGQIAGERDSEAGDEDDDDYDDYREFGTDFRNQRNPSSANRNNHNRNNRFGQ